MKNLLIVCSVLALSSCERPWIIKDASEPLLLPDVRPVSGGHCESSAMMNALRYQGYEINESMVAGGGAALSFMFEKTTFPFLSARGLDMREVFFDGAGIEWHKSLPETPGDVWPEVINLLKNGIPVILRVDMRYLPYRYNGRYGPSTQSFGWHMITLFGVDPKKEIAYVSDTQFSGLQTIKLKDLHKARVSDTRVYPPKGEYYWVEAKPDNYTVAWDRLTENSINNVIKNYESRQTDKTKTSLVGIEGLKAYGETLADIETYSTKSFLLPFVFEFMAGNIEDFGTGGAAFRILYRDFLVQAAEKSRYAELQQTIPLLNDSIESWHALASEFRKAATLIKKLPKDEKTELYRQLKQKADDLCEKEEKFYTELKIVYTKSNYADNR